MGKLLRQISEARNEFNLSATAKAINTLGKEKVQTLQNECKPRLYMVRKSAGSVSCIILPLANWFIKLKRVDLYNKSRVMGDYQARFCERFGGETPPYLLDPFFRHSLPSPFLLSLCPPNCLVKLMSRAGQPLHRTIGLHWTLSTLSPWCGGGTLAKAWDVRWTVWLWHVCLWVGLTLNSKRTLLFTCCPKVC